MGSKQTEFNWSDIRVLTFDCYGTLIDWENGLLETLKPILRAHDVHVPDASILELYAELERFAEQEPYHEYKSVLKSVVDGFAARLQFEIDPRERECLIHSLKHWMPFSDTVDALRVLKSKFRLAAISNIDEIFSRSRSNDWEFVLTG